MKVSCVILAAGASARFEGNKLTHPLAQGGTLLDRAVRACGSSPTVVVCPASLREQLDATRVTIVVNEEPALGMAHSLQLANRVIDSDRSIAVLVADLLLIESKDVDGLIAAAGGADVTFPQREDGTPGHPVIFSPRARDEIEKLPPGDTIRLLRDNQHLLRRVIPIEQSWPYHDVDYNEDLRQ